MGRTGAKGIKALHDDPESQALDHLEWLGLLLDHEATSRQQKRFERRLRTARLRHAASVEDVDYRASRGLDRNLFKKLGAPKPLAMSGSANGATR